MTRVLWDQVGERVFQTGVDRGVLYLPDNSGIVWNGLVSVTEQFAREVKVFHMDGVKYQEWHVPGEFSAELKAFTYPEEFDELNGVVLDDGVSFHDQMPKKFGMSYRTLIGDDVDGTDRAYRIHILWNLMANPSSIPYSTIGQQAVPIPFTWIISGTPSSVLNYKPTCHISIESDKIDPRYLELLEDKLYGTDTTDPVLPTLMELFALDDIVIIDNGDGTWTAVGPDYLITMTDPTTFQIIEANASYSDANTYTISSDV